ncbi:MAG: alpha-glucosidase [Treponemataceae bacterium]|nr:alpha-glucosidase [Treponemataceae bacterium]
MLQGTIREWWKEQVVYQIYPRSFCDSNGDGIGDIPGIISRLDYLEELGIGIIWLSPLYKSPNDDNGYDISDYMDINPEYGTMEDMKALIKACKDRSIRLIMDLVINHTSDEHKWFQESRKSKENPYRDYYIWRPGIKLGGKELPPNNWTSFFTGSAWQKDEETGEYYLHLFSKKQPDLNYKNPQVIREVKEILKFWLDMGISGFRCDVINVIGKTSLKNGRKRIALTGLEHYLSQEECHRILRELNEEIFSKYDCFTVGETVMVTPEMANELSAPDRGELNMVFGFQHMETDCINNKWFKTPFISSRFMSVLEKWQKEVLWNANYFENHDQPRSVSHFGNDEDFHDESAKMLAVLLFSLRGTPYIFEGQELGMTNFDYSSMDEIEDIESHNIWKMAEELHFPEKIRWSMIKKTSRDNARTPMQWSTAENAGFSTGKPWLRPNSNYVKYNAEAEEKDCQSVFSFYKQLISLRKEKSAFVYGAFSILYKANDIYIIERSLAGQKKLYTIMNFSEKKRFLPEEAVQLYARCKMLISNYTIRRQGEYKIKPYEAFILEER